MKDINELQVGQKIWFWQAGALPFGGWVEATVQTLAHISGETVAVVETDYLTRLTWGNASKIEPRQDDISPVERSFSRAGTPAVGLLGGKHGVIQWDNPAGTMIAFDYGASACYYEEAEDIFWKIA